MIDNKDEKLGKIKLWYQFDQPLPLDGWTIPLRRSMRERTGNDLMDFLHKNPNQYFALIYHEDSRGIKVDVYRVKEG